LIAVLLLGGTAITLGSRPAQTCGAERRDGNAVAGYGKRGPMKRDVRGSGHSGAREVLFIPATTDGPAWRSAWCSKATGSSGYGPVHFEQPELQNSMVDAEYQLKTEQAKYTDLQMTLEKQGLDQKAAAATVNSGTNRRS